VLDANVGSGRSNEEKMITVAAILLHYWKQRTDNVKRVIEDLKRGTRPPDKIVVFNNNKDVVFPPIPDVIVINSTHNYHCLMRHAMGLMAGTDLCLFVDDDITLQVNGLAYLLQQHHSYPKAIIGFEGRRLGRDRNAPYTSGSRVHHVSRPTPVDIVLGRVHLCHVTKLVNSFVMRSKIGNFSDNSVGSYSTDDILLSLSNRILNRAQNYVVPSKAIELSERGVGYHGTDKQHYPRRNAACRKLLGYG